MAVRTDVKLTRKGVKKFAQALEVLLIFFLYILADFIKAGGEINFITDKQYWYITIINMILVISMMVAVRSMRKQKRIDNDAFICDGMLAIQTGFNKITFNGLSSKLDEYLAEENKENKFQTFKRKMQKKLIKIDAKEAHFGWILGHKRFIAKRKKINDLLELSKEEVCKRNFRYKSVTVSKLFSAIDGRVVNDNVYDLDTYEFQDVAKMVSIKALFVVLFSAFVGSLAFEFFWNGVDAVFSICIKLFSLALAVNSSLNVADDFVDNNIIPSLQKRLRLLAGFKNSAPEVFEILNKKEQ